MFAFVEALSVICGLIWSVVWMMRRGRESSCCFSASRGMFYFLLIFFVFFFFLLPCAGARDFLAEAAIGEAV